MKKKFKGFGRYLGTSYDGFEDIMDLLNAIEAALGDRSDGSSPKKTKCISESRVYR